MVGYFERIRKMRQDRDFGFYLADPAKLYFIPLCNGDMEPGKCGGCIRRRCKGFWAGETPLGENSQAPMVAPIVETREKRVERLTIAYAPYLEGEDGPSCVSELSPPSPSTMLGAKEDRERRLYRGVRLRSSEVLGDERVDWES